MSGREIELRMRNHRTGWSAWISMRVAGIRTTRSTHTNDPAERPLVRRIHEDPARDPRMTAKRITHGSVHPAVSREYEAA